MLVFYMDLGATEEFFRRVSEVPEDTEANRTKILLDLVNEGRIDGIMKTYRSKDQVVADLAKNFKVLQIRSDEEGE